MRTSLVSFALVASLAGCSPDVAPGSYYCGPERLCPEEQACDGATHLCVDPRNVTEFSCGDESTEMEPNNTPATAQPLGPLVCTARIESVGCIIRDTDGEDFYSFVAPADCGMQRASIRASAPVAFEPIVVEILDANGGVLGTAAPCSGQVDGGTLEYCGQANIDAGASYAVRVTGEGAADCNGACAFNRYELSVILLPR